jgi:hypothetical protein
MLSHQTCSACLPISCSGLASIAGPGIAEGWILRQLTNYVKLWVGEEGKRRSYLSFDDEENLGETRRDWLPL